MNDSLRQLRTDVMYLAHRQRALEDAMCEWTEFMTRELLRQGIKLEKYKTTNNYFKQSLREKFKQDYEKFESLFLGVNTLFGNKKRKVNKYKEYI